MTRNYITDTRDVDAEDVREDYATVADQLGRLRAAFRLYPPGQLKLIADMLDIIDNEKGAPADQRQTQTWLRCLANTVLTLHARQGGAFLEEPVNRTPRGLCESAKKGHCCPDDICHGSDVTLCGFDKEHYEEILRDMDDECEEPEREDASDAEAR